MGNKHSTKISQKACDDKFKGCTKSNNVPEFVANSF